MATLTLRSSTFPDGHIRLTHADMPMSIGRSQRSGIVVNDQQLSRIHAEFRFSVNGRFEVADLDSTNLTIVNERDVDLVELKTGDHILVGDTEITVEVEYPEEDFHEVTTREIPMIRPDESTST